MDHHFVPKFLLRAWSDGASDGMFQEFRLDVKSLPTRRRAPKATAYQDNLYALTKPEVAGMSQQAIETDLMSHIDNYAAPVRVKMEQHGFKANYPYHLPCVPCPLPRRTGTGAFVGYSPVPRGLPLISGGSASTSSLLRPAQASLAFGPQGRSTAQGGLCHRASVPPVTVPSTEGCQHQVFHCQTKNCLAFLCFPALCFPDLFECTLANLPSSKRFSLLSSSRLECRKPLPACNYLHLQKN